MPKMHVQYMYMYMCALPHPGIGVLLILVKYHLSNGGHEDQDMRVHSLDCPEVHLFHLWLADCPSAAPSLSHALIVDRLGLGDRSCGLNSTGHVTRESVALQNAARWPVEGVGMSGGGRCGELCSERGRGI